jgi:hypothetical protein
MCSLAINESSKSLVSKHCGGSICFVISEYNKAGLGVLIKLFFPKHQLLTKKQKKSLRYWVSWISPNFKFSVATSLLISNLDLLEILSCLFWAEGCGTSKCHQSPVVVGSPDLGNTVIAQAWRKSPGRNSQLSYFTDKNTGKTPFLTCSAWTFFF